MAKSKKSSSLVLNYYVPIVFGVVLLMMVSVLGAIAGTQWYWSQHISYYSLIMEWPVFWGLFTFAVLGFVVAVGRAAKFTRSLRRRY